MTNVLPLSIQQPDTKIETIKDPEAAAQLLGSTLNAVEQWRNGKTNKRESIPDALCRQIFALEPFYSPVQLCSFFRINSGRYRSMRDNYIPDDRQGTPARHLKVKTDPAKAAPPQLCEIKIKPDSPYALEPLPSGKTLIVEFCRHDGQIMKIHTTQDSIPTLMHTFFAER